MIDAVMYGMIPSANTAAARQRAAREQVEEADRAPAPVRGRVLQREDGVEVDVRDGQERAEPEDRDDEDREQDLVPQVRDPEHVPQAREPSHRLDDLPSAWSTRKSVV